MFLFFFLVKNLSGDFLLFPKRGERVTYDDEIEKPPEANLCFGAIQINYIEKLFIQH